MKKFTKIIACACLALCCALMFTACGGGYKGTYSLYSVTVTVGTDTITVTKNQYDAAVAKQEAGDEALTQEEEMIVMIGSEMFSATMQIILKDDGIVEQIMQEEGEEPEIMAGTYTVDGETLTITADNDTQTATIKDGVIIVSNEDMGMTMVFKK